MRPHTRTQCTDGKDCSECVPAAQDQEPVAGPSMGGGGGGGHHGVAAGGHNGGHHAVGHYSSTNHPPPHILNDPFVAPTSGPLRRSITNAAAAAARTARAEAAAAAKSAAAAAASGGGGGSAGLNRSILIVELPAEILVKILNYMSFKEISQVRLVSRRFNEICASMLNRTFQKLQSHMLSRFQAIKGQMPRRESARRNHPLARECDIVETLHMRLTLLQMTFGKHIERKHVCFFAGEILDEVQRILRYIRQTPCLQRAYKVTDELFDLSTMAMEYFKEHIEPTLPEISYFGAEFLDFATPFATPTKRRSQSGSTASLMSGTGGANAGPSTSSGTSGVVGVGGVSGSGMGMGMDVSVSPPCSSRASVAGSSCSSEPWSVSSASGAGGVSSDDGFYGGSGGGMGGFAPPIPPAPPAPPPNQSNMVLRKRIRRIRQGMKRYNDQLVEVRKDLKSCKSKMESQSKQVQEYSNRLDEYDKKFEREFQKFQTLLTELNKCKTELQYWRSKSTTLMSLPPVCVQCEAPLIEGAPVPGEGVPEGAPEGAGAAGLAGDAAAELAAAEQAELAAAAAAEADEAGGVGGGGLVAQDGIPAVPTEPSAAGMDTLTAAGCMDTAVATPAATSGEVVKQQSLSKSGPPSPVAHPSSSGGGRKRRSRDEDSVPTSPATEGRKSLRGNGVKGRAGKRLKLAGDRSRDALASGQ